MLALAFIVSCVGQGQTPVVLPTAAGTSPARVKPARMARTVRLNASAMTSRTPANVGDTLGVGGWIQISGSASAVAPTGNSNILALSDQPAGPDKAIWSYAGGTWTNISGLATGLAETPNGTMYAINSGGGIFAYAAGNWTGLGGGASFLAAASDNSIFVISNGGAGPDRSIWHYSGGIWTQMPGSGVAVFSSLDTTSRNAAGGTVSPGGTYVVNSAGGIYYLNDDGSNVRLPAQASSLAASATAPQGVFALAYPLAPGGSALYFYDFGILPDGQNRTCWTQQPGAAISVAVDGTNLDVVAASGAIYRNTIQDVSPSPTPSPTPPWTSPPPC